MRIARRTLPLLTFCVSLLIAMRVSAHAPSGPQTQLIGRWRLTRVAGTDPSTVQIKAYSTAFDKNGTWTYTATMSGNFEGMQLKGQGTWAIQDGALSWTAGANAGTSKIIFSGTNQLALDPDPVVTTPGGKQAVRTDYVRVIDGK